MTLICIRSLWRLNRNVSQVIKTNEPVAPFWDLVKDLECVLVSNIYTLWLFIAVQQFYLITGGRFGLAQSKAGIVTVLSKYSVHLADIAKKKPFEISPTTFLTSAKDGIWIKFKRRF